MVRQQALCHHLETCILSYVTGHLQPSPICEGENKPVSLTIQVTMTPGAPFHVPASQKSHPTGQLWSATVSDAAEGGPSGPVRWPLANHWWAQMPTDGLRKCPIHPTADFQALIPVAWMDRVKQFMPIPLPHLKEKPGCDLKRHEGVELIKQAFQVRGLQCKASIFHKADLWTKNETTQPQDMLLC